MAEPGFWQEIRKGSSGAEGKRRAGKPAKAYLPLAIRGRLLYGRANFAHI